MYNSIKQIIKSKKEDIDEQTLNYFTNYFYVIVEKNIIPEQIKLEELIDNALLFASKVEFYNENHWVYKKYGEEVKGLCDSDNKTIYIRNNLDEILKEITIYHELHHAVQTNVENNKIGINQKSNIGRLIMEAQTQWLAEEVYKRIHNINFPKQEIFTEDIRMEEGGKIISALHNYQMYDCMLSKLAVLLDVEKDFFVSINYLYKDDIGIKQLEEKYNQVQEKYNLDYSFYEIMLMLDYIYCVDLLVYMDTEEKERISLGKTSKRKYCIYPNVEKRISLKTQSKYIYDFDSSNFIKLFENNGDYSSFSNYIVSNKLRDLSQKIIKLDLEEQESENNKVKEKDLKEN